MQSYCLNHDPGDAGVSVPCTSCGLAVIVMLRPNNWAMLFKEASQLWKPCQVEYELSLSVSVESMVYDISGFLPNVSQDEGLEYV